MSWYGWRPYVPVHRRRAQAAKKMEKLRKKGVNIQPIEIAGRSIATTFWGQAWCGHLEKFSDFANRLPRGRTYVRNGSVCHLDIGPGKITAIVSGSELYNVNIKIGKLSPPKWRAIKRRCAGQIGSLLELLQGKLSDNVMKVVTDRQQGLFPLPREISLHCDCPDWATMCKHVAAALYGAGARLDKSPELLFLLRGVDHQELLSADTDTVTAATAGAGSTRRRLRADALADVFGIDLAQDDTAPPEQPTPRPRRFAAKKKKATRKKRTAKKILPNKKVARKKAVSKKAVRKKTVRKKVAATKPVKKKAVRKEVAGKKVTSKKVAGKNVASKKPISKKVAKKKVAKRTASAGRAVAPRLLKKRTAKRTGP